MTTSVRLQILLTARPSTHKTHTQTQTQKHTYTHTYTHLHTSTHTHTHTHKGWGPYLSEVIEALWLRRWISSSAHTDDKLGQGHSFWPPLLDIRQRVSWSLPQRRGGGINVSMYELSWNCTTGWGGSLCLHGNRWPYNLNWWRMCRSQRGEEACIEKVETHIKGIWQWQGSGTAGVAPCGGDWIPACPDGFAIFAVIAGL